MNGFNVTSKVIIQQFTGFVCDYDYSQTIHNHFFSYYLDSFYHMEIYFTIPYVNQLEFDLLLEYRRSVSGWFISI